MEAFNINSSSSPVTGSPFSSGPNRSLASDGGMNMLTMDFGFEVCSFLHQTTSPKLWFIMKMYSSPLIIRAWIWECFGRMKNSFSYRIPFIKQNNKKKHKKDFHGVEIYCLAEDASLFACWRLGEYFSGQEPQNSFPFGIKLSWDEPKAVCHRKESCPSKPARSCATNLSRKSTRVVFFVELSRKVIVKSEKFPLIAVIYGSN